jgi:cytochrome oxidase Cu insertion factor (SCO1/SenC/PrrC family)
MTMTSPEEKPPVSQMRSRLVLLLIAAMFLSSFGIAAFLRFTGWQPAHSKNFGELLQPPRDLSAQHFLRADGQPYDWNPQANIWRIVVVPSADCQSACTAMIDTLHRVWETEGRQADRVDVLWFGAVPAGAPTFRRFVPMRPNAAIAAALPEAASRDAMPVYLIDPSGYLVMHYRADFVPGDLHKDLGKLIEPVR